jgi:hypothetical protein
MKPTRKRNLLLLATMSLLVGATVARVYLVSTGRIVPISLWTPSAVAIIDATLFMWAMTVRRRLMHLARARHDKRSPGTPFVMQDPPLDSMTAARTVALAFAASRAGAMLSGLYAGMGLLLLRHWGTGDVQWRVGLCGATTVLSVLLVVIALWIERMCKLPDPPANAQTSVA